MPTGLEDGRRRNGVVIPQASKHKVLFRAPQRTRRNTGRQPEPGKQMSVQAPRGGRVGEADRPASSCSRWGFWRLENGRGRDKWSRVALKAVLLVLALALAC
jgi:hypothetical protein